MGWRTCLLVEDRFDRILVQRHPQTLNLKFLADRPSIIIKLKISVYCREGDHSDHTWMSCCSAIPIGDLADLQVGRNMEVCGYWICGSYFADGL
jgi:hypothetical protein